MKITVVGTGYLGATQAVCLASLGHDVVGVDIDPHTVDSLNAGQAPVYEPGLDDLLVAGLAGGPGAGAGRLRFTTSWQDAADHAQVHLLCVGTPQNPDGWAMDTSSIDDVVDALVPRLGGKHILIGRSTVPVGTAAKLGDRIQELLVEGAEVSLCWSPEFLREGYGIEDSLHPDRIVLGVAEPGSVQAARIEQVFREIYAETVMSAPVLVTDLPTAELVKVAANAFLSTKISFINAVADVCDAAGADILALSTALGMDDRIGPGGMHPGLGFGGGCLPKDLRGFAACAEELGSQDAVALLEVVDSVNLHRRDVVVEQARGILGESPRGRKIAVLGAAFKPGNDDIRDSPALTVAVALHRDGAQVMVHDPRALDSARQCFPSLEYAESIEAALSGAELLIVATDWPEFQSLEPRRAHDLVKNPVVIDGRHCLPAQQWRAAGWDYRVVGRRISASG